MITLQTTEGFHGCVAWTDVESTNLQAVGVTADHALVVRFQNGAVYRYPRAATHLIPMITADSVGRYFNANIRSGVAFEKIH